MPGGLAAQDSAAHDEANEPSAFRTKYAVSALCLCMAAHFFSITSLFSYSGFLAVDAGWSNDIDSAGFVVGILASALPLARCVTLSQIVWGILVWASSNEQLSTALDIDLLSASAPRRQTGMAGG